MTSCIIIVNDTCCALAQAYQKTIYRIPNRLCVTCRKTCALCGEQSREPHPTVDLTQCRIPPVCCCFQSSLTFCKTDMIPQDIMNPAMGPEFRTLVAEPALPAGGVGERWFSTPFWDQLNSMHLHYALGCVMHLRAQSKSTIVAV